MNIFYDRLKNPLLFFFLAVVAVIESVWILKSKGFYYIDECAHYLYSRFVLSSLPAIVETWHRPGRLWLYALPSQAGHTFTMFFSLALFICILLITYKIAKLKGIRHAEWVVLLTGLQPILFDISYACLTETPTALVLVLAYWFHLKEKHQWSMTIASALFLFRFEMYLFTLLLFIVYMRRREWNILPLVFLGPLLWIGQTTILSGDVMTFFKEWSRFSGIGKFIPGVSVTHYFENLHTTFGYAQLVFFIIGVIYIAKAKRSSDFRIIYCTMFFTIIFHTLAGAEIFHWTASIGELRYMAVIGPFFGIVAVYGFSEIFNRVKPLWARQAFALLIFTIIVFNCTRTTHPRRWANYDQIVIDMTKEARLQYPDLTLLCNNSIAAYIMDVSPNGGQHFAKLNYKTLKKNPRCIILWDPFMANSAFTQVELTKEKMLQDTTVQVIDKYYYYNAEYLLLYRDNRSR